MSNKGKGPDAKIIPAPDDKSRNTKIPPANKDTKGEVDKTAELGISKNVDEEANGIFDKGVGADDIDTKNELPNARNKSNVHLLDEKKDFSRASDIENEGKPLIRTEAKLKSNDEKLKFAQSIIKGGAQLFSYDSASL